MFTKISEAEFFSRAGTPIDYIGIYELEWIIDDSLLVCEGIIVAFSDRKYLIKPHIRSEDVFDFSYYIFSEEYDCRKILSSDAEPIHFIRLEVSEYNSFDLRFQIGNRPIIVGADDDTFLMVGISRWDANGDLLYFENFNLLNDK